MLNLIIFVLIKMSVNEKRSCSVSVEHVKKGCDAVPELLLILSRLLLHGQQSCM